MRGTGSGRDRHPPAAAGSIVQTSSGGGQLVGRNRGRDPKGDALLIRGKGLKRVHLIDAVIIGDPIPGNLYPRLLDVIGRCPPGDVGGLAGYENFFGATSNPKHPDHEELTEWAGEPFDPHVPDADELRLEVLKLAKKWKPRTT